MATARRCTVDDEQAYEEGAGGGRRMDGAVCVRTELNSPRSDALVVPGIPLALGLTFIHCVQPATGNVLVSSLRCGVAPTSVLVLRGR